MAVVVVAVVDLAPASMPALEGAAAAADKALLSRKDDPFPHLAANESSPVQSIINEQISSIKEVIAETPIHKSTRDLSFVDALFLKFATSSHALLFF